MLKIIFKILLQVSNKNTKSKFENMYLLTRVANLLK
jgi:hypothetical protein